jgi:hydroxyacylglutathione hydrolase
MSLPAHLEGVAPPGLVPGQPIAQFELGPMQNFVYLVIDWATKRAALVDPQRDVETPLGALAAHGLTLERILITHSHHDHVAGLPRLAAQRPDLPVHVGQEDLFRLPPRDALRPARDGEVVRVSDLELEALHTPGHSAGHLCWLARGLDRPYLLGGDTLFIRDCGRTDLETGDDAAMFASLQRLKRLAPETVLLPGHHYKPEVASTLARELETSPPLRARTVTELASLP